MKSVLRKILNHLETELVCYQELSDNYDVQKEVLIKNKHDELQEIDNKFTMLYNKITKLNGLRKTLFNELKSGVEKLSDVVAIAKQEESPHAERLEEMMEQFKQIKSNLERKRYVNFELLKNGVTITDKKLGIIIEAITPQGSIYNRRGKNKDLKDISVSTIDKEV